MRRLFFIVLLVFASAGQGRAQDVSAVELRIERLRVQLRDVLDREARLQERSQQLEEDLRPENVERSVAAIGTTDAAALRARRREDLERQKADVDGQLSEASAKRAGLETEIAAAEAEAVRLKAATLAPRATSPSATPAAAPAAAPAARKQAPAKKSAPRRRNRPRRARGGRGFVVIPTFTSEQGPSSPGARASLPA